MTLPLQHWPWHDAVPDCCDSCLLDHKLAVWSGIEDPMAADRHADMVYKSITYDQHAAFLGPHGYTLYRAWLIRELGK